MARGRNLSRSEMMTVRFDARTRFALEFVARVAGQSMTTVLERALLAHAAGISVPVENGDGQKPKKVTWKDLWSECDGERELRMAAIESLYPSTDDRVKLAFAREHWPFFFTDATCREFMPFYIDVLWPHIDRFVLIRVEQSDTNWMAAGEAMAAMLRAARIEPPTWPPVTPAAV